MMSDCITFHNEDIFAMLQFSASKGSTVLHARSSSIIILLLFFVLGSLCDRVYLEVATAAVTFRLLGEMTRRSSIVLFDKHEEGLITVRKS